MIFERLLFTAPPSDFYLNIFSVMPPLTSLFTRDASLSFRLDFLHLQHVPAKIFMC